jgi:hypothetical protein
MPAAPGVDVSDGTWLLAGRVTALDRQTGELTVGATTVWLPRGRLTTDLRPGMDFVITVEACAGRTQVTAFRPLRGFSA